MSPNSPYEKDSRKNTSNKYFKHLKYLKLKMNQPHSSEFGVRVETLYRYTLYDIQYYTTRLPLVSGIELACLSVWW